MSEPLVIFLHLPKAAGSTLNRVIARHYPAAAIHHIGAKPRAALLAEVATLTSPRSPIQVLTGHAAYGIHAGITREFTYVTVLRDPVERLLSHFHFARSLPQHPLYQDIASGRLGIRDVAAKLNNLQTQYLIDDATRQGPPATNEVLLANAQENLARDFVVVGLAERFEETLVLLRRKLGWKIAAVRSSNVNRSRPKRTAHSEAELAAIRAANSVDIDLYSWARTRFEAEVADAGADFQRAVAWLRAKNRLHRWSGNALQALRRRS